MIAPFDLFGEGKYQYTFQMKCLESENLWLEDGVTRIFLNTRGTNDSEVSEELIALLRYFEETSEEAAEQSGSEEEGKSEGENQFAALTKRMIRDGRTEELLRVSEEPEYRRKLYREYGLEEEE